MAVTEKQRKCVFRFCVCLCMCVCYWKQQSKDVCDSENERKQSGTQLRGQHVRVGCGANSALSLAIFLFHASVSPTLMHGAVRDWNLVNAHQSPLIIMLINGFVGDSIHNKNTWMEFYTVLYCKSVAKIKLVRMFHLLCKKTSCLTGKSCNLYHMPIKWDGSFGIKSLHLVLKLPLF